MTSSNGASSTGFGRPFVFPMFSTIQHPKPHVTNVDDGRIPVEVYRWAL